jgi:UDP-N-acetylmuramate dehydrogenase
VGGPARFLAQAESENDVIEALAWADARALPVTVLGGGSNLLIADRGLPGLALAVRLRGVAMDDRDDLGVAIEVAAGEPWDPFVELAVSRGLAGIECLSGIPGDVGATPIQNVGAYGQEVCETVMSVHMIDRSSRAPVVFDNAACGFGYRDSVFKRHAKDRFVVTRVRFALRRDGAPTLRYPELRAHLGADERPSLAAVRAAVLELRRRKSMLFDLDDENGRSAGSFFMNPVLDRHSFTGALARIESAGVLRSGETVPHYPAADGAVKLSAAWLIERAGFAKGTCEGRVGLSTRHTLAIVNKGGATAAEIVAFARRVRSGVRTRFGVTLQPEPVFVGFEPHEIEDLV